MEEIIQKLKLCFRKSHIVSDLDIKFQILTIQVTSPIAENERGHDR